MIHQDLKKKIVNTISKYEVKFDKMQLEINTLKNVINQLIIGPISTHYEIEDHLAQFQKQLDEEFDPVALDKKAEFLATQILKLQKKRVRDNQKVSGLIKQGTETVSRLASKSVDKRAVSKLQQILDTETESQAILINFNEVLSQCVSSVEKKLEELLVSQKAKGDASDVSAIDVEVNDSLQQLLNHLAIPKDLDSKKEDIKKILEHPMESEELIKTIDGVTELVVDAFNVEQNRFKGFLHQLTNQLQDVDVYLRLSSDNSKQSSDESMRLEDGIQDNINQIKNHLDKSKTIEELTSKISQNLDGIGDRIKKFRDKERIREQELEKKINGLKEKLEESEQGAQEIKALLSFQKYKVNHDSLTGLPNRESYDEHIQEAFDRWQRSEKEFSLAVCDIDHFKKINDTFGHLAGDKVLKKVAEIFKKNLRKVDFIARIGGEEFVILFEQTSSKTAESILEKLRKLIENCQFYYREQKVDVTVSFGLSTINKDEDIETLFVRADNAMYKAKNAGRNTVEVL